MPYMELRDYSEHSGDIEAEQRDQLIDVVTSHLAQGEGKDGTFEFRYLPKGSNIDLCEYEYVLVIDLGRTDEREARKNEIARSIGIDLEPVLGTESFAVRLRLQNAAFVPFEKLT